MSQALDATELVSPAPRLPHPSLRGLVDGYSGYHYAVSEPGVHRGLPSVAMTVVLAFEAPLDVGWMDEPRSRGSHWQVASGLHTAPAEIHHEGVQCGIQLGLTADGARVLLGIPMSALAAAIVPLEHVLPAALIDVHEMLADLLTWEARYDAIDRALVGFAASRAVGEVAVPRPELRWAWDHIVADGGRTPVSEVATQLGWSRRHLASQFRDEFGLSPKQLARVTRFQRSRDLVARGHALADVAAGCGFADQSHLTREWRALSGYTPLQWLAAEFPFVQDLDADDLAQ